MIAHLQHTQIRRYSQEIQTMLVLSSTSLQVLFQQDMSSLERTQILVMIIHYELRYMADLKVRFRSNLTSRTSILYDDNVSEESHKVNINSFTLLSLAIHDNSTFFECSSLNNTGLILN